MVEPARAEVLVRLLSRHRQKLFHYNFTLLPDDEVARRVARSESAMWSMRRKQHIRRLFRANSWTQVEEALLGTIPDEELARRHRKTASAVRLKRQKLGLPNPSGHG